MKLENVTLDNVLATRKIITDKLAMAIRQPSGIDEGRYANLLADVKALDEIAAPLIERKEIADRARIAKREADFREFVKANGDNYKSEEDARRVFEASA